MKIKIFIGDKPIEMEDEVNEFIKNKEIEDVKITEWSVFGADSTNVTGNTILVLYDDSISKLKEVYK